MVSLDRFDTFKAVVEAGSLTAAADLLGQTRAVVASTLNAGSQLGSHAPSTPANCAERCRRTLLPRVRACAKRHDCRWKRARSMPSSRPWHYHHRGIRVGCGCPLERSAACID